MKATKKILSLVLALMMVLSSVAALADGEATVTCNHSDSSKEQFVRTVAPTCTDEGYTEYYCDVIRDYYKVDVKAALDHHMVTDQVVQAGDCGKDQIEDLKCDRCNTYTEKNVTTKKATGKHSKPENLNVVKDESATCIADGVKIEEGVCPTCGLVVDFTSKTEEKKTHKWSVYFEFDAKTGACKGVKENLDAVAGEDPAGATGRVTAPADKNKAATCTEDGVAAVYCTLCKELHTEVIPATGHKLQPIDWPTDNSPEAQATRNEFASRGLESIWIENNEYVGKNPTCTENGYYLLQCVNMNCPGGEDSTRKVTVPADGHHYDGYVEYKQNGKIVLNPLPCLPYTVITHCSRYNPDEPYNPDNCQLTITSEQPATEKHNYSRRAYHDKPATCTEEGVDMYQCACGAYTEKVVPKKAHNENAVITTIPTCTVDGVKTYTCKDCGAVRTETLAKFNHPKDNRVTSYPVAVQCGVKDGVKVVTCTKCNTEISREVVDAKTSHTVDPKAPTTKVKQVQTCKQDGIYVGFCTVCRQPNMTMVVEKKEHEFKTEAEINDMINVATGATGENVYYKVLQKQGCFTDMKVVPICYNKDENGKYCGAEAEKSFVPAGKAAFGSHYRVNENVVKEATCTEPGLRKFNCNRVDCEYHDKALEEEIPAIGHTWVIVRKDDKGNTELKCTVCGETKTIEESEPNYTLDVSAVVKNGTTSGTGKVKKVAGLAVNGELYVRISWSYTLSDGSTMLYVAVKPLDEIGDDECVFDTTSPSKPYGAKLDDVTFHLVNNADADRAAFTALAKAYK